VNKTEKDVKIGKTIVVTIDYDGKKEVKKYECNNYLTVQVNDLIVSTTIVGMNPLRPVVWRF